MPSPSPSAGERREAGAELDAEVARVVMGWKFCGDHEPFRWHKDRAGLILRSGPEKFRPHAPGGIPEKWWPSSRIADAWDVVEKMKERGWLVHVLQMSDGWVVNMREYRVMGNWQEATTAPGFVQEPGEENELPATICVAALSALSPSNKERNEP